MSKTSPSPQLATSDDLADEVAALAGDLKAKDLKFLIALVTSDSIAEASRAVGIHQATGEKKAKKLKPVMDKIYPVLQREAIKGLTVLVPKATAALGELLDDLKDSKTDTKRKTAEAILDRVIGRPTARPTTKPQSDKEVKVQFKGWQPPVVPVGSSDNLKKKK